jgi:hypothetical protein
MIFHIILIMLLALWGWERQADRAPKILLAATWGTAEKEGDKPTKNPTDDRPVKLESGQEKTPQPPEKPPEPEPPKPPTPEELRERETREKIEELSVSPAELSEKLPPLDRIKSELARTDSPRMHQGRDPRVRAQLVEHEGGTIFTEAGVVHGLRWLSRHQAEDGHWSLDHFSHHGGCNGRCGGHGQAHSDTGGTALALLPFLGAGQTHERGIYQSNVRRGLGWLIDQQRRHNDPKEDGDLRGEGSGNMYAHGIAAIALCEAYALSHDDWLREPAQRAVNFIVHAQHSAGGWRYKPREPGDLSVVGWQLMALQSAKMAGLSVPDKVFNRAGDYLDSVQHDSAGGRYSYQTGKPPDPAMIAEGLLCRQYLGWPADHAGMQAGVEYFTRHLPDKRQPNIYYWYYGTQVLHHLGGEPWEAWNAAMIDALLNLQATSGHEAGSWEPLGGAIGGHDVQQGGRLYMTALAVCTLEVYYRHLPIYRSVEVK